MILVITYGIRAVLILKKIMFDWIRARCYGTGKYDLFIFNG